MGPSVRHAFPAAALVALAAAGCAPDEKRLLGRIDTALAKAGGFMIARQSPDGAWRSETYGCFKTGPSLTAHVTSAMFFIPQAGGQARAAFRGGVDYLAGFLAPDGRLKVRRRELLFPAFDAASASRVIGLARKTPRNRRARQAWLEYLRARQLNERLGWRPSDREYGGWGFSLEVPRKPPPGQPKERFFESNMVATIYGLAAMRSAGVPLSDPGYAQILRFACRCQNFAADPAGGDGSFDDGGFFFIPGDAGQNKAGVAGTDRFGRRRFSSYGTMTADGLRILLRCGLKPDHPRVAAARHWLQRHFSPADNPGNFAPDREVIRNAVYYYWAWACSHAFLALRQPQLRTPRGRVAWPAALARELLRRQRPDGSWVNRFTDAKEDDPLVATPFASAALAICRTFITGEYKTLRGRCPTAQEKPPPK